MTRNMKIEGTNPNLIARRVKEPCLYIFFSYVQRGQLGLCKNVPSP